MSPLGKQRDGWLKRLLTASWNYLTFRAYIAGLNLVFGRIGLGWIFLRLSGEIKREETHGDYVERQMKGMAKGFGVEVDDKVLMG